MRSTTTLSLFLLIFSIKRSRIEQDDSDQKLQVSACCGFHCINIRTYFISHREGACLGLGLAVSSLCKESLVDSRVHVINLYNKLMDMLTKQDDPDQKLQVGSLMRPHY